MSADDMWPERQAEPQDDREKAYGGCRNCYGKGYATYRSAYSGHDTDTDIGSPGGRYYQPYEEMRFCACDRGKQLQQLIRQQVRRARIDAVEEYLGICRISVVEPSLASLEAFQEGQRLALAELNNIERRES